jgi:hypothetical protein
MNEFRVTSDVVVKSDGETGELEIIADRSEEVSIHISAGERISFPAKNIRIYRGPSFWLRDRWWNEDVFALPYDRVPLPGQVKFAATMDVVGSLTLHQLQGGNRAAIARLRDRLKAWYVKTRRTNRA